MEDRIVNKVANIFMTRNFMIAPTLPTTDTDSKLIMSQNNEKLAIQQPPHY